MNCPSRILLMIVLAFSSLSIWAEEEEAPVAFLVRVTETRPIEGLTWKTGPIEIRTSQTSSDAKAGVAIVEGKFHRPHWTLSVGDEPVKIDDKFHFQISVPIKGRMTQFVAKARGPKGEVEPEINWITFDGWEAFNENLDEFSEAGLSDLTQTLSGPWHVAFVPSLFAFSLNATDQINNAGASLNSIISWAIEMQGGYRWNPDLDLFVFGQLTQIRPILDPSKTLSPTVDFLFGAGVGANYRLLPDVTVSTRVSAGQEFFLRAIDINTITLDNVFIPHLRVTGDWGFAQLKGVPVGVGAGGGIYLGLSGPNESVNTGYEILARVFAKQALGSLGGTLALEYQHKSLGSNLATQVFDTVLLELTLNLGL
jgi:hypothetical protein